MALRVFEVTFAVIASLSPATNACIYKSAGLGNRAKNAIRLWRIPAPSVAFPHGLRDVHARWLLPSLCQSFGCQIWPG
jgi:hypothetical protein